MCRCDRTPVSIEFKSAREEYAPERARAEIVDYCQSFNLDLLGWLVGLHF